MTLLPSRGIAFPAIPRTTTLPRQRRCGDSSCGSGPGSQLDHVGQFSIDPATPARATSRTSSAWPRSRSVWPGRCCIDGEHARGDFYIPMATTEGTLVASYNRGMRLLTECGGVTTTVVDDQHAAGAGVHPRRTRCAARDFGEWVDEHFAEIKAAAEIDDELREADLDRPVRGRSAALPPVQLHDR